VSCMTLGIKYLNQHCLFFSSRSFVCVYSFSTQAFVFYLFRVMLFYFNEKQVSVYLTYHSHLINVWPSSVFDYSCHQGLSFRSSSDYWQFTKMSIPPICFFRRDALIWALLFRTWASCCIACVSVFWAARALKFLYPHVSAACSLAFGWWLLLFASLWNRLT
jgi:hypothetical protein